MIVPLPEYSNYVNIAAEHSVCYSCDGKHVFVVGDVGHSFAYRQRIYYANNHSHF